MAKQWLKVTTISLAFILGACSSTGGSSGGANGPNSNAYGDGQASTYYDEMYGRRGTEDRIIYFDFDSDRLRQESYNVVNAHAAELKKTPNRGIILEGHTDDRGSREYNIGLGERRARSVSQLMVSQGVSPNQIRVISYGKERPAVEGSDEGAWAQNRRVEIIY